MTVMIHSLEGGEEKPSSLNNYKPYSQRSLRQSGILDCIRVSTLKLNETRASMWKVNSFIAFVKKFIVFQLNFSKTIAATYRVIRFFRCFVTGRRFRVRTNDRPLQNLK